MVGLASGNMPVLCLDRIRLMPTRAPETPIHVVIAASQAAAGAHHGIGEISADASISAIAKITAISTGVGGQALGSAEGPPVRRAGLQQRFTAAPGPRKPGTSPEAVSV
jgi:hypothetical protein